MLDEPPMILAELSVNELAPPEIPALRLPARPGSNATTAAPPSAKPLPLRAAADALGGGGAASGDDAAVDDKLTPRILEALAVLDAEAEKLSALPSPRAFSTDDDEEPDWLKEASEKATAVSKGSHGGGGSSSSSASSSSSSVLTTPRLLDDDDAEGEPSQPLDVAPTAAAAAAPPAGIGGDAHLVPTILATLGQELACSESNCHHLRSSAEAQAATVAEVANQLELTKSAAAATAAAARKIVDDHEADVRLLLGELRKHLPADAAAAVEKRLSAPQAALAARKRHAAAAAAARKKQSQPSHHQQQENGGGNGGGFGASVLRSLSFGRGGGARAASSSSSSTRAGGGAAPGGGGGGDRRDESPMLERFANAASEMGREVVRRARESSPFRERPGSSSSSSRPPAPAPRRGAARE